MNLLMAPTLNDANNIAEAFHLDPSAWKVASFGAALGGPRFGKVIVFVDRSHVPTEEEIEYFKGLERTLGPKEKVMFI